MGGDMNEPNELTEAQAADLARRFGYHPPQDSETIAKHEDARTIMHGAAEFVCLVTAPSREQSLALTHLEDAMMWTNAAIARQGADVDRG
jgi:hypothetical protein